jgi:uncharacterized protein (TIGR02246 family)
MFTSAKLHAGTRRHKEKVTMVAQHAADESEIRRLIDEHVEALRAMDVERLMSIYAPDILSFDLDPPLRYRGTEAKRKRWTEVLAMYQRPLDYEIRDLTITVGDDVAFGHSLNRISGTMKNGNTTGFWLRWTACLRKVDGNWLIAHEQVSVPVDPASGRASLNLTP